MTIVYCDDRECECNEAGQCMLGDIKVEVCK